MATYQKKLRENLSCPVCYETFNYGDRLPKGLPCLHTLCLSCLDKYVKKNLDQKYLCPLCQAKFAVPDGGAKAIPNNTIPMSMLEILETDTADNENGENEHASDETSIDKKLEIPKCRDHGNAACIIYCVECQVPLCTKCMTVSKIHNSHTLEDIVSMTEKINTDVDKNVKLFNKIVSDFDSFSDKTLTRIMNQNKDIIAKIKEDIDKEAEKFHQECKEKVHSELKVILQEFDNFTTTFNENKSEFETNLKEYRTSDGIFNTDIVDKMENKLKILESLNAKFPEMSSSSKFDNTFKVEACFELKHAKNTFSTETHADKRNTCSITEIKGATGGYDDEATKNLDEAMGKCTVISEMSRISRGTNTDKLTLTSVPIIIPSGTVDLHLHITNWNAFLKDLNEEEEGDWWFIKGAVWRVIACFQKPFKEDWNKFPRHKPVLYVGVEFEKRSKRSKYTATWDTLFKNYSNGRWESYDQSEDSVNDMTPTNCKVGYDIFSKEWLMSGENPLGRKNAKRIC